MTLGRVILHQIQDPGLSFEDRIELRCELAKNLEEEGKYEAAQEMMLEVWREIGQKPVLEGLTDKTQAEVLVRVGALSGWIGSANQIDGAQEQAKDLIYQGLRIFETLNQPPKIAEAQTELAVCYWREGYFGEARVILQTALATLSDIESDTRLIALLRRSINEKSARRYQDAFRIQMEAVPLFERTSNLTLKGKFHHLFGFVLRKLSEVELRRDYIDQALIEYAAASYYFEEAGLTRHRACVENNLGFLFGTIGRFSDAHEHLDLAQTLFTSLKDSVHLAQVDETRARVMLTEGRIVEAEKTVRTAVRTLEQGDEQSLLAEALTTHGIAHARLKHAEQAKAALQRAVEVAESAGDLESAGNAALVLVEELLNHVPNDELKTTIDRAADLLANTQDLSTLKRLTNCAGLVLKQVHASARFPGKVDWAKFDFRKRLLEYEAHFINLALEDARGVVSRAARLLGFNHHQSLLSMLNGRHEVLRHRGKPILPRRRSIIGKPSQNGSDPAKRRKRKIRILLVEHDPSVTHLVHENLEALGVEIQEINDGTAAMETIVGRSHYDVLVIGSEIPGVNGQQLTRLARSVGQYKKTPIILMRANAQDESIQLDDPNLFILRDDDLGAVTEIVHQLFQPIKA